MSRLRGPFLSDRYFFITVRLLKGRGRLRDADFRLLAMALNRTRRQHPFYLTAWVFLPDHWHAICGPVYPLTISQVMKSAILVARTSGIEVRGFSRPSSSIAGAVNGLNCGRRGFLTVPCVP